MTTPYCIVVGNEKGGTGKSTLAMNIIVHMLKQGMRVASMDMDGRQATLTAYFRNRMNFIKNTGIKLGVPLHVSITVGDVVDGEAAARDRQRFMGTVHELGSKADFIVIDTPGSHNHLLPVIHSYADVLVTPVGDSLVDLDVIAKIEPDTLNVLGSSHYARVVWKARQEKAAAKKKPLAWLLAKSRTGMLVNANQAQIDGVIKHLSKRLGFSVIEGMKERPVYRELFLKGLTVLDLKSDDSTGLAMHHIAARQEIRSIVKNILENCR